MKTKINLSFILKIVALVMPLAFGLSLYLYFLKDVCLGCDYTHAFKPAAELLLSGQSPYLDGYFYSFPWALILYLPFTLIPYPFDSFLLIAVSMSAFGFVAHKLGAKPITIALLLGTPQYLHGLIYGNCDSLIALGLLLPPGLGIILFSLKPQIGAPLIIFAIIEAWRVGGFKKAVRVCIPLGVLFLLSVAVYGTELLHILDAKANWWNISGWPNLIPIGLILIYKSLKERNRRFSILAGPFVTPYIGAYSLPFTILGLLPSQIETVIAILAMWGIWIFQGGF